MKNLHIKLFLITMTLVMLCSCSVRNMEEKEQSSSAPAEQSSSSSSEIPPLPALKVVAGPNSYEIETTKEAVESEEKIPISSLKEIPSISLDTEASVKIKLGKDIVFNGTTAQLSQFKPSQNGIYEYEINAVNAGEFCKYTFKAEINIKPQISFDSSSVVLGEALVIYADFAGDTEITATTSLNFKPQFFSNGNGKMALLPVHYATKPGKYKLTIKAGEETSEYNITVGAKDFVVQRLTVDEDTTSNTVGNNDANEEWNKKIEPLKKISEPQKYWSGSFLQPVAGKITTEFGTTRYVNDSPNPSRHGGIDIAAKADTPVVAANGGKVLFADFIQLTGNTVVIEHGMGLKSWYYHMNSINVKAGDIVKKGDLVGAVGSTGFSTGPHLHYAISVNNVYINPWTAFEKGIK